MTRCIRLEALRSALSCLPLPRYIEATGRTAAARGLTDALRARVEHVRAAARLGELTRPRVLCLEWLDPLQGGHWIPEMVAAAGGEAVLAMAGAKSVRLRWEDVIAADPEIVVMMPCGFHLHETIAQVKAQSWTANLPAAWKGVSAVLHREIYAMDGTAYFRVLGRGW